MQFVQYPARSWEEILPEVGREEREVVGGLVRWEGGGRWGAGEVSLGFAFFFCLCVFCFGVFGVFFFVWE